MKPTFAAGLSDWPAAEAVRADADWMDALVLKLEGRGFESLIQQILHNPLGFSRVPTIPGGVIFHFLCVAAPSRAYFNGANDNRTVTVHQERHAGQIAGVGTLKVVDAAHLLSAGAAYFLISRLH